MIEGIQEPKSFNDYETDAHNAIQDEIDQDGLTEALLGMMKLAQTPMEATKIFDYIPETGYARRKEMEDRVHTIKSQLQDLSDGNGLPRRNAA